MKSILNVLLFSILATPILSVVIPSPVYTEPTLDNVDRAEETSPVFPLEEGLELTVRDEEKIYVMLPVLWWNVLKFRVPLYLAGAGVSLS
ncbi:hypothetical protein VTN77DRAFT_1299 [Rasamsonia byssochlamydoides]|uniref:uncharacterized protein n=1 Tax=Rasamsonia byssochlamydoides TaxID=89139 RepID=UPI0037431F4E